MQNIPRRNFVRGGNVLANEKVQLRNLARFDSPHTGRLINYTIAVTRCLLASCACIIRVISLAKSKFPHA